MAEIVQSLFGVTPESYQQAQQDRINAQAMQYARLDPFQQANYAIGRGANMLGGAIGGALGGQDPELQRITARQQIARQINLTDPASIQQGMAMLQQAGDTVGLQQLAQIFRQQQESGALVTQREAAALASEAAAKREKAAPTTNDLTNARAIAAQAGPVGSIEYNAAFKKEYDRLTAPKEAKGPGFGTDREAVSAEVYDMPFAQLTPTQKAVVNARVEAEGKGKAAAGAAKFVMPGDKALSDIPAFRATVQRTIEPQLKAITATDQALQAINDSLATGNFASYRAAQVQFAKAIAGAGDLSQKELKAAGADPSLLGGAADVVSTLFSSTPTEDTQKKIRSTLQAIRTVAAKQANREVDQQRKIALRSPGYSAEGVNEALMFPELQAPTTSRVTLPANDQALLDKYAPKAR